MNTAPAARLLIVDDEAAQMTALCRTLEVEGYATTGTVSANEALQRLREQRFDVLITDLMMDELDGIALLRAAHAVDPDLACIVMTGHGTIDTAVEAMRSGALDYILKPFNLREITSVLSRTLDIRRLRLENAALVQRITERSAQLEAANGQLRVANRELDAFTRTVSHDLRSPLGTIIGFAELMIQGKAGALTPQQLDYLGEIFNGGKRLLHLTDALLRFARLGHQPLKRERVDVNALVDEVLRELRSLEPERSVAIRVGPLPEMHGDAVLLRQVFANLLSNALKFTGRTPDAAVTVEGHREDPECVYVVSDNGAGFDMRQADRLFTLFQRLHGEDQFAGTGVGLSIVQRIIERHGGRIDAQSQVGKGARFTIALPA
jgi:two-component system sensor histidine kinase/response regulator